MIKKLLIGFLAAGLIFTTSVTALDITVINCVPHTGVGIAKFNDDITDYAILENLRVYPNETKVWQLEPGYYGVTHFSFLTGSVLYYRNIEVKPEHTEPLTYKFGECKDEL